LFYSTTKHTKHTNRPPPKRRATIPCAPKEIA
jgi:hypothetical protein